MASTKNSPRSGSSAKRNPRKNAPTSAAAPAASRTAGQTFDPKVRIGKDGKPKKRRWYHNVVDGYRITNQILPETKFWVWGGIAAVLLIFLVLAAVTGRWIFYPILGLLIASVVGMSLLSWKITRARYAQLDGQLGAVGALLGEGRRGWSTSQEPIHVNPRTRDLVYRIVGRPGVVLLSEGPAHRVGRTLEDERRRITRVMPEVPVHVVQIGNDEGQVPISRMWRTVSRLKGNRITSNEVAVVAKRLDAMAQKRMPIPKGVDPTKTRMSRRALRGK